MRHGVGQIEAIDIGFLDPGLQFIGHRFRTADEQRAKAADAHPVRQRFHRPLTIRVGGEKRLNRRLDGVGMQVFQHLVRPILTEVNTGPAGDQRQRCLPIVARPFLALRR